MPLDTSPYSYRCSIGLPNETPTLSCEKSSGTRIIEEIWWTLKDFLAWQMSWLFQRSGQRAQQTNSEMMKNRPFILQHHFANEVICPTGCSASTTGMTRELNWKTKSDKLFKKALHRCLFFLIILCFFMVVGRFNCHHWQPHVSGTWFWWNPLIGRDQVFMCKKWKSMQKWKHRENKTGKVSWDQPKLKWCMAMEKLVQAHI